MVNDNAVRTQGKYDNFLTTNQDTQTRTHFGNNDFIRQLHIGQTQVGQVAFYSTVNVENLINLGFHHPVVFDRVITNIGGAYHPYTGIFITPVDGVYVFNLCAMSIARKFQYLELAKDGSTIQSMLPDAGTIDSYASANLVAVLELNKGNEVRVRTGCGSGQIHGNSFTSFSRWLLFVK